MAEGDSPNSPTSQLPRRKVSGCTYVIYYFVLFFAYWFGAKRFDFDGDGDFDPEDVQAYLADHGILQKNFARSARKHERAKLRREQSRAKRRQAALGRQKSDQTNKVVSNEQSSGEFNPVDVEASNNARPRSNSNEAVGVAFSEGQEGVMQVKSSVSEKMPWERATFEVNAGDAAIAADSFDPVLEDEDTPESLVQKPPFFILLEIILLLVLWIAGAVTSHADDIFSAKGGLDSWLEHQTDLRIADGDCEDLRPEAWRWLTYQFTHMGAMHVACNCFLLAILGVPLEGTHGSSRMAIMFNMGVLGGACAWFVYDSHNPVVGASGGCYGLLGVHLADVVLNFRQKKFRIASLVLLIVIAAVEIAIFIACGASERTSNAAHIGGAFFGLVFGIIVVRNYKVRCWERVLKCLCALIGFGLMAYCIAFIFLQTSGPRNFVESMNGIKGYCWHRQFWNDTIDEYRYLCVRCGNKDCIAEWSKQKWLQQVSAAKCNDQGWYYMG